MRLLPNRLLFFTVLCCHAFMPQTACAEQIPVPVTGSYQLGIQLPDVDRNALVEQVRILRSQLIRRKQALLQAVSDKKLDTQDYIITVIMPGGLLYAGYRKARYEQAKNELARVSAEIDEYSHDILAMQPGSLPVALVQQH